MQLTRLQIAHRVMVGRGLILAQPMDHLRSGSWPEVSSQSQRFLWLLHGQVHVIHGGCGFSRQLLHSIGQITWITEGMKWNPEGNWVLFAEKSLRNLRVLKQVNEERTQPLPWGEGHPIGFIRGIEEGYTIVERDEMTDVSAEAWRIAAIAYLQCRALR